LLRSRRHLPQTPEPLPGIFPRVGQLYSHAGRLRFASAIGPMIAMASRVCSDSDKPCSAGRTIPRRKSATPDRIGQSDCANLGPVREPVPPTSRSTPELPRGDLDCPPSPHTEGASNCHTPQSNPGAIPDPPVALAGAAHASG
jgi:hypothetical protein